MFLCVFYGIFKAAVSTTRKFESPFEYAMKLSKALPVRSFDINLSEFKRFISGYNWYFGVRLLLAVLIPSIILYHYGLLLQYFMLLNGIFLLGLGDTPGSVQRRFGSMLIGVGAFSILGMIAGFSRDNFLLAIVVLMILGFVCSLVGVYGSRIGTVGTSTLILVIFFMDKSFVPDGQILQNAAYLAAGGLFYMLIVWVSVKLRPYRVIEQTLGEHIIEISKLLNIRSRFYDEDYKDSGFKTQLDQMMHSQIILDKQQEELREIILKARELTNETTSKSRVLLMMFLESINVFELIINSQQNYQSLHRSFDNSGILAKIEDYIIFLSKRLEEVGVAIQQRKNIKRKGQLDIRYRALEEEFYRLRSEKMDAENMEAFMTLRQIMYTVKDLTESVKKLRVATSFDKGLVVDFHPDNSDLRVFVPKQAYGFGLFWSQFSLKSDMFRHSLRVAIALMVGEIIGHLLGMGHAYWITMTIVIVMKPAYSLARKKYFDRIKGTLIGGVLSFGIIYLTHNDVVLFSLLVVAMLISCTLIRVNYFIYAIGITTMVISVYAFLNIKVVDSVLFLRVGNSITGGVIGFLASYFILPNYEHQFIRKLMLEVVQSNQNYFDRIMLAFKAKNHDFTQLNLSRRNMFIALANLSDSFQRMLSDPKGKRGNVQLMLGFVTACHGLASYLVSLSQYAQINHNKFDENEFSEPSRIIDDNFKEMIIRLDTNLSSPEITVKNKLPENQKLKALLETHRQLLMKGGGTKTEATSIRKTITDYLAINGLFDFVNSSLVEQGKILLQLYPRLKDSQI